ncbi:MAG: PAS domain S-box protein [Alphaproteobacteria bacterium]
MNLSTRLTAAMVALVALTVLAVSYFSYRNLEAAIIPSEISRLEARAHMQAAMLDSYVRWARADVLASTGSTGLNNLIIALSRGGTQDGVSAIGWRERFTENVLAHLNAKPAYYQFRVIGLADGGREILRVDRMGPKGTVRIVPDNELQRKGDQPYFAETLRAPRGSVYVSPIELNREKGAIAEPHVPVMRLGKPIFTTEGKLFGVVVINIDMRPAFAELRGMVPDNASGFVISETGNFLVHPDRTREFGWELGQRYRWQGVNQDEAIFGDAKLRIAGGPQITVVDVLPLSAALASARTIGQSSMIGAIVAALCAALLAALVARSFTRPLRALTHSVEHFTGEESVDVPEHDKSEMGVLARAFKRMADAVREKTGALQSEIEERKRVEQLIRKYAEREKLYIAAVTSANDAIFTSDLGGNLTTWNPAAERMFGYSAEEAIGNNVSIIATPEQRAEQKRYLEAVGRGERIVGIEAVRQTKQGTPIEVSFNFSPIFSDSGEVIGGSAIARDITERKQADRMFRLAVESSPGAMIMADAEGKIILVNQETERMFGYAHGELVGKPVDILIPKEVRDAHVQHRKDYAKDPARRMMGAGRDLFGMRKDGSPVAIEIGLNPIRTPNGLLVLASIVDITERKRHEKTMAERTAELQRSNSELEQFAYVASHDLQEPLRMVASYAELLAERYHGKLDEKAEKYIAYAVDGAKRMQRLVNDLLTFSRVGTQGHPPQPADANMIVRQSLRALKPTIDEARAEIEIGQLPVITADDVQLGQVFQNLIGNSLKFRVPDRPLRLHIGARAISGGWQFFVEDNGIGIDTKYSDRIFQMFQRLHDRETYEGSGIGLTIARKIVERHRGRIWFESEPGKGTTFYFTMPATQEKAA